MKRHELKTWPGPFQAVWDGEKTHEFRKDDRGYERLDLLLLREWVPSVERDEEGAPVSGAFTGRVVLAEVTYVGRGFGIPHGYVALSIRMVARQVEANGPPARST